jgi:hypothetical protein
VPNGLGSPNPLQATSDTAAISMQVRTEEIISTQFIRQSEMGQIPLATPRFSVYFRLPCGIYRHKQTGITM